MGALAGAAQLGDWGGLGAVRFPAPHTPESGAEVGCRGSFLPGAIGRRLPWTFPSGLAVNSSLLQGTQGP